MKKRVLSLALILSAGAQLAFAQDRVVKGKVLDSAGQPYAGAEVKTFDGKVSTSTDENGEFEITIPSGGNNRLEVITGEYATQHLTINPGETDVVFNLTTTSSSEVYEEVVINTGYLRTTTKEYTGSANVLTSKDLEKFPVDNVTKMFEGQTGTSTTNAGGQPGSTAGIQIRGTGSLSGGTGPLYVVDGAQYNGDITMINPLDIESVVTLKDATATSLYGARGANGVIVITTKRGKRSKTGAPNIVLDLKGGVLTQGIKNYDMVSDPGKYYELAWDAYRNNLMTTGFTTDINEANAMASADLINQLGGYNLYNVPDDQLIDPATGQLRSGASLLYTPDSWEKELSRLGSMQDYNVSASGATEDMDYYVSLGYRNDKGFTKFTDNDRITSRINVNAKFARIFKFGVNVNAAYSTTNFSTNGGTSGGYNPFYASRANPIIYPVYYRNANGEREFDPLTGTDKFDWGSVSLYPNSSIGDRASLRNANALGSLTLDKDRVRGFEIVAIPYLEAAITPNITVGTRINVGYNSTLGESYNNPIYGQFAQQSGTVSRTNYQYFNYTWSQYANYTKRFSEDKHGIDVYAGHESYYWNRNYLSASRNGVSFPGNTNLTGAAVATGSNSQDDNIRMESYLARANYDYLGKIFLNASVRTDGNSRFSPSNRWGTFWAVGGGYDLKSAEFMQSLKGVDMLKLKASYGSQGNDNIGLYAWQSLYSVDFANGNYSGALISNIGNQNLTWENQKQFQVGFDYSFLKRISGEIVYFDRTVVDMLYNLPMAPSTGIASRPVNVMDMTNKGVELAVNALIVSPKTTGDFSWSTGINLTKVVNQITKMAVQDSIINGNQIYTKGHDLYSFYLVENAGVDELGNELYYTKDADGQKVTTTTWTDANNYGRSIVGIGRPDFEGSWSNQIAFKGFDLSTLVTFGIGGYVYDGIYQSLMGSSNLNWGANFHNDLITGNRWTQENQTGASLPRLELSNTDIGNSSTRFLTDASYLNIRTISLGYSLPTNIANKIKLGSVRIYTSLDNVYLFTKRQGLNPQAFFGGGSDYIYYPARTLSFGVRVGL